MNTHCVVTFDTKALYQVYSITDIRAVFFIFPFCFSFFIFTQTAAVVGPRDRSSWRSRRTSPRAAQTVVQKLSGRHVVNSTIKPLAPAQPERTACVRYSPMDIISISVSRLMTSAATADATPDIKVATTGVPVNGNIWLSDLRIDGKMDEDYFDI